MPMETRITKLEEFADDAKQRLVRIEMQLAHLNLRIDAMNLRMDGFATKADLAVLNTRMDSLATTAELARSEKRVIAWVATTVVLAQMLPTLIERLSAI